MSLLSQRTKWVLFLSGPNPEERHIWDLVFGLMCLERAGVSHNDIFLYIDDSMDKLSSFLAMGTTHSYQVKTSEMFFTEASQNIHKNLVMFITGHGSPEGIHGAQPIAPSKLVSTIKGMPSLDNAIVYLGQCYAGLFNYVKAGRAGGGANKEAEIILIGATNLHESLSHPTKEEFLTDSIAWPANLFLLHVFKWITSPIDVDGDGQITVMDSYKYAGVYSNMSNKRFKTRGFTQMIDQHQEYKKCEAAAKIVTGNWVADMLSELELKAANEKYQNSLNVHYVHQECWILNSYPAQKIAF